MTPEALEKYRERVYTALEASGFDVEQLKRQAHSAHAAKPRRKKLTSPCTTQSSIHHLRDGFQEFRLHPRHGKPIPRCQAKRASRADGQCAYFSVKGSRTCRYHGGRPETNSTRGRKPIHGRETAAIRTKRKEGLKIIKGLELLKTNFSEF